MRWIASILLTALLGFVGGLYFPWWIIAVTSFVVALLFVFQPFNSFVIGFVSIFILWVLLAWIIDASNQSQLSGKIGMLMGIGRSPFVLILITGVVGGLVSGLGALTGNLFMQIFAKKPAVRSF